MTILNILKYPDTILEQKALAVTVIDEEIKKLVEDMVETMYAAPGIGLAANQVGVLKRIIVIDINSGKDECDGTTLIKLINPEIISKEGKTRYKEGCLSVPEMEEYIQRFEKVVVTGLNEFGEEVEYEADGLPAIVFQHEIDHLEGITLVNRVSKLKKNQYIKKIKKEHLDQSDPDKVNI